MSTNEFIFSNKGSIRAIRHLSFWGLYSVYFFVQSIVPKGIEDFSKAQTYLDALVSVLCFVPVCILFVYTCIYHLLPRYLQKGRYGIFLVNFLALCLLGEFLNYFMAGYFFHFANAPWAGTEITAASQLDLATVNTCWALLIGVIAIGLKLSKQWYFQLHENLKIGQKKVMLELDSQKSRIQPEFLFRCLTNIHRKILSNSRSSAEMILNLSDFLSYTLYQQNSRSSTVKDEIEAIHNLISLEKNSGSTRAEIQLHVHNLDQSKLVPSQILLSLVLDSLDTIKHATSTGILMIAINSIGNFINAQLVVQKLSDFSSETVSWENIIHKHEENFAQFFNNLEYKIALQQTHYETIINLELGLKSDDFLTLPSVTHTILNHDKASVHIF